MLGDDAGAHVVVPVPSARAERDLIAAGRDRGLWLDGLARHHAGRPRWHGAATVSYTHRQFTEVLPELVTLLATHADPATASVTQVGSGA